MELKRHLHQLLHLLAPDLRRREFYARERFLNGGGKSWIARAHDLEGARLVAPALIDDELRQDLTLDTLVFQRRWILRNVAADSLYRLLDLELHVWAMLLFDTRFLTGVSFLARTTLHAFG